MDTKVQGRLEECKLLTEMLTQEQTTDELRKKVREQLEDVVGKLWDDHKKYMGPKKKEREYIWLVLNNGLKALTLA